MIRFLVDSSWLLVVRIFLLILFVSSCFVSCNNNKADQQTQFSETQIEEHFINANKILVKNELGEIEKYIAAHHDSMESTGSGLRYRIYSKGKGEKAGIGKIVSIKYSVSLMNGGVCYSSKEKGLLCFNIGKGETIKGLEEGVSLLTLGDKAVFIIPSHLAYGIQGDDNKIPGRASLVYDVELIDVK